MTTNPPSDGYTVPNYRRLSDIEPHKKRRLKSPKAKGDKYERELADYLNTHLNLSSSRAPLSGGGVSYARSTATPGADLIGTPHLWVEAKRVNKLNFRAAMAQAINGTTCSNSPDFPIVITRRDREELEDSICAIRLKDFLHLYRAYLNKSAPPAPPNDGSDVVT